MTVNTKISIIIPVYNESFESINNLEKFHRFFNKKNIAHEIIVVNDGSTQNSDILEQTVSSLENIKYISLPKNMGKGYAIREGILASAGEHIFFADADHSTPIEHFDELYSHIDLHDVVIGSRHLEKDSILIPQPPLRRFVSWWARFIIGNLLLKRKVVDSQCGFKLFSSKSAKEICAKQTIYRWGFDAELLAIAINKNYKIKEVPVKWRHEPFSQIKAFPDSWKTFLEVIKIKLNLLNKKYD